MTSRDTPLPRYYEYRLSIYASPGAVLARRLPVSAIPQILVYIHIHIRVPYLIVLTVPPIPPLIHSHL